MEKWKWTNIKAVETGIIKMREEGRTRQEIADMLGLEKVQIKNWISRYNRERAHLAAGLPPKRRGRPRKSGYSTIEECQYGIRRLKIENELLRDFLQKHCRQTYSYRRMWMWLEKQGIHHNPKTVLRIMKKYDLLAEIRCPRKWVNMGRQVHRYENILNRDFHADRPNPKWVTDISYIQTGQAVLYLSMIRDLHDNSIVAYKTAESQTVSLALDTIRLVVKQEKKQVAGRLQLHSGQDSQYTSQAYFNLTRKYSITPSMSRRGNCYDNALAENFFSILKSECIYRQKIKSFQQANQLIDDFISLIEVNSKHQACRAEQWKSEAISSDSEFVNGFGVLARELDMAIAVTFLDQYESGPHNSMVLFDRFGERKITYTKVHTCDFDVERSLMPGEGFYVTALDTACGEVKVGAMICYDRESPKSARILMLKGTDLILVPNACPMEINRLSQLRARAYENILAIATCNYPDSVPDCNGGSSLFDGVVYLPDLEGSRDMCILQADGAEGIYLAELDLEQLRLYRENEVHGNAFRRPQKYGLLLDEKLSRRLFGVVAINNSSIH